MKLRAKILLLLVPLTVLPLLALGWIAYGELRSSAESRVFAGMQVAADYLRDSVATEVRTAEANLALFAANNLVRKYVLASDEEERYALLQGPVLRVFAGIQDAFPTYSEIRILLPDGYEDIRRITGHWPNRTEEEAENPLFRAMAAAAPASYSAVFHNPDNGRFSLFSGRPLILGDPAVDPVGTLPSLRGYIAITIDLSKVASYIREHVIGTRGYLFATDSAGGVVFHSDRLGQEDLAVLGTKTFDRDVFSAVPVAVKLGGKASHVRATELYPGLNLFTVIPESERSDATRRLAWAVAAITLLAIAVAGGCLFLALERLVICPLETLRIQSKEVGRGNLDVENVLTSRDEIGELGTAFSDMATSLQRSDERIRYIAYHDSLTGLPNRAMFKEYLGFAIANAERNDKQFALLFLDIDDFKRINDTLGHQAGDQLLREVSDRLSKCLRRSDYMARMQHFDEPDEILARLGGDEFVLLLPDIADPHAAGSLANRLLETLSQPAVIDGHEFYISASIGITLYPGDGNNADELIKSADIAMYHAKEHGKNDYQYYLESMNVLAHERLLLETRLRRALENNQLSLAYQPQVDTASGEITGLEALLRWHDPEQGWISPASFIPVAEESGLILPIGEWVINEACRQSHAWQTAGLPPIRIAVNISGVQFARQEIARLIAGALQRYRIVPGYLEVEITETAIMAQPDRAIRELSAIKALGVGVALDDFGTGYSSFSYLHRFPIDTLKIDRSFIRDLSEKSEQAEIVAAMVAMAHTLKLQVVAEGIETENQLRILERCDCDTLQGYLFKKPVTAGEIPDLLTARFLNTA